VILVTGATGYTGRFLVPALVEAGEVVCCLVRPSSDRQYLDALKVESRVGDLDRPESIQDAFAGVKKVLHLAHIRYTPVLCQCLTASIEHVVLVSSLWGMSQIPSALVDQVRAGEAYAVKWGLPHTIVRPSMIYGPGNDRNLSRLAAFVRRWRWLPVFGSGEYLQQPVYVEDVVQAIQRAMAKPPIGAVYAIAGAQAISYNALIDQVGAAIGVRPLKLHLPVKWVLAGLWGLQRLGLGIAMKREQILRLQEDKSYSIEAAQRALDYAPLNLAEGLKRIYCGDAAQ